MNDMSRAAAPTTAEDRCPGTSYTDLLEADTRRAPDYLLQESNRDFPDEPIDTHRYVSDEWLERENRLMWPNVWQFAAREEDLPNPGDTVVFDNANRSYLLIRQKDGEVRAFHNVCPHRGRKLRTGPGRVTSVICPFHGFAWHSDGRLKEIPCAWDFQHLDHGEMALVPVRVDRWQGFLMVTENPDLPPFRDWVGPGIEHYDNWRLDECSTAVWVGRVIPANWKATAEAFMEAWHSVTTHPQILPFTGDANTRYDVYGDFLNRAITPSGSLSPHITGRDQQYVLQKLAEFTGQGGDAEGAGGKMGEGKQERRYAAKLDAGDLDPDDPNFARKVLAQANRDGQSAQNGRDYSAATDSEMIDNFTYNIFPNFAPWGGFVPNIVYRWRPWAGPDGKLSPDHCLMEVRILMRRPEGAPVAKGPEMHLIPSDQPFMSAAHLLGEGLAGVFDQDMANLPYVQDGMKASPTGLLQLGSYQESRVRHFAETMDKYMAGALP